jgi:hypothetical protein
LSSKPKIKKPGAVNKIIPSRITAGPEMAEISIEGADDLYREVRIENALQNKQGESVKLKEGALVSVTIEADHSQTVPITHED